MHKRPKLPDRSAAAIDFVRWSFESGKSQAGMLSYVALPPDLIQQIEQYWQQSFEAPKISESATGKHVTLVAKDRSGASSPKAQAEIRTAHLRWGGRSGRKGLLSAREFELGSRYLFFHPPRCPGAPPIDRGAGPNSGPDCRNDRSAGRFCCRCQAPACAGCRRSGGRAGTPGRAFRRGGVCGLLRRRDSWTPTPTAPRKGGGKRHRRRGTQSRRASSALTWAGWRLRRISSCRRRRRPCPARCAA